MSANSRTTINSGLVDANLAGAGSADPDRVRAAPAELSSVRSGPARPWITVLVVDDDFRVARVHSAFVERVDGFRVLGSASSAAETLDAARRLRPDLLLLDLYLPDVFGLNLISQLRLAQAESDLIVISAANESQTVERALKLGVVDYLLKPFTQADLSVRLTEYRAQRAVPRPATVGGQPEIDRMFRRPSAGRTAALPKGMSAETAELIMATLAGAEQELSAQECADAAGMSRVSARRYLEHFVRRGRAEVTRRYGARGRPERRYSR